MFEQGKRKPRKQLTEEQRSAIQAIKDYCTQTNTTKDEIAQMFGLASWNSFLACNTTGRRAELIAQSIQKIKRHTLNTSNLFR